MTHPNARLSSHDEQVVTHRDIRPARAIAAISSSPAGNRLFCHRVRLAAPDTGRGLDVPTRYQTAGESHGGRVT